MKRIAHAPKYSMTVIQMHAEETEGDEVGEKQKTRTKRKQLDQKPPRPIDGWERGNISLNQRQWRESREKTRLQN